MNTDDLASALRQASDLFALKSAKEAQIALLQDELEAIDTQIKALADTIDPVSSALKDYAAAL